MFSFTGHSRIMNDSNVMDVSLHRISSFTKVDEKLRGLSKKIYLKTNENTRKRFGQIPVLLLLNIIVFLLVAFRPALMKFLETLFQNVKKFSDGFSARSSYLEI